MQNIDKKLTAVNKQKIDQHGSSSKQKLSLVSRAKEGEDEDQVQVVIQGDGIKGMLRDEDTFHDDNLTFAVHFICSPRRCACDKLWSA